MGLTGTCELCGDYIGPKAAWCRRCEQDIGTLTEVHKLRGENEDLRKQLEAAWKALPESADKTRGIWHAIHSTIDRLIREREHYKIKVGLFREIAGNIHELVNGVNKQVQRIAGPEPKDCGTCALPPKDCTTCAFGDSQPDPPDCFACYDTVNQVFLNWRKLGWTNNE